MTLLSNIKTGCQMSLMFCGFLRKPKVYRGKWAIENNVCHSENFMGTFLLNSETILVIDDMQNIEKSV